jgi:repressor LexA
MEKAAIIEKLITEKGFSSKRNFAEHIDMPVTTLQSILKRGVGKASINNVLRICKGLGITADELERMAETPTGIIAEPTAEYRVTQNIRIPLFGDIAAGALATIDSVTKQDVDHIVIPKNFLGKYTSSKNLFALKVNGESMNTVIPNGSIVIAKPINHADLRDEDIVIYSHDGEYSMKRFRKVEEDNVLVFSPESTNKKFRDRIVPYNTQSDLKIHGKVISYSVFLD